MGSYPRREKAEQQARARADTVPALDCQACGALTPGERFRYWCDQIVCEACDTRNPATRRTMVPRAWLEPHDIFVNFGGGPGGHTVQAMALDCRTMLGPRVPVANPQTLRRLLTYLGATAEQLADFDQCERSWGQGTARITLEPCRKNLLRLKR